MSGTSVSGLDDAKKQLKDMSDKVAEGLRSITQHYGALVQADVQNRARAMFHVTDYDKQVTMRMQGGKDNPAAFITSSAPQAHRLEYGFSGTDSAGRSYHEPARPHFRPALARYADSFRSSVEALFK